MTPAVRRRAKRGEGERLRADILAAAERLLIQTGDQGAVSIRAIADAAGVTPPSIYLHFADKTELLGAVCEVRFGELAKHMDAAAHGIKDSLEALRAMGMSYVQFGLENPEHYRIMFMTRPLTDTPPGELNMLPGLTAFGQVVDAVDRCMRAGTIPDGDPFLVATNLWTAVHGVTSLLIARPDFPWPDFDRLMALVLDVQSKGLQT
jgi:AcrR family transcriptional regulator